MKIKHWILLLLVGAGSLTAGAQTEPCSTFDQILENVAKAYETDDYEAALIHLKAARACDPSREEQINAWYDRVFDGINRQKEEAEAARQQAQRDRDLALAALRRAEIAERTAIEEQNKAIDAKNMAQEAEKEARKAEKTAERERRRAEKQKEIAEDKAREATAGNYAIRARQLMDAGEYTQALRYAEKAYHTKPTPETAAQLGSIAYDPEASFYRDEFQVKGEISAIGISPDLGFVVLGNNNGQLYFYHLDSQKLTSIPVAHSSGITAIDISSDGQRVITGSTDAKAMIWNMAGEKLLELSGHDFAVTCVRFSPSGKYLLTGAEDNKAILWNQEGQMLRTLEGHQQKIAALAFAPGEKRIATAAWDQKVYIWDLQGELLDQIKTKGVVFSQIEISKDEKTLFGNGAGVIYQTSMENQNHRIHQIEDSPHNADLNSGFYASLSENNCIAIYRLLPERKEISKIHYGKGTLLRHKLSSDGQLLVTISPQGKVRTWRIPANQKRTAFHLTEYSPFVHIDFHPQKKLALVSSYHGMTLIDLALDQSWFIPKSNWAIYSFSPWDDHILAIGVNSPKLTVYNYQGNLLKTVEHQSIILNFDVDLASSSVLISNAAGVFELDSSFQISQKLSGLTYDFRLSHNKERLVQYDDQNLYFKNLESDSTLQVPGEAKWVELADDSLVVVGSKDYVSMYNLNTGKEVKSIYASFDGGISDPYNGLLTTYKGRKGQLLDWKKNELYLFPEFNSVINKIYLSDDGKYMIINCDSGEIRILPTLGYLLSAEMAKH